MWDYVLAGSQLNTYDAGVGITAEVLRPTRRSTVSDHPGRRYESNIFIRDSVNFSSVEFINTSSYSLECSVRVCAISNVTLCNRL